MNNSRHTRLMEEWYPVWFDGTDIDGWLNPPDCLWYQEWWIGSDNHFSTGYSQRERALYITSCYPSGVIDGMCNRIKGSGWEAWREFIN